MKHLNIGALCVATVVSLSSEAAKADSVEHALRELQPSSVIEYTRMIGGQATLWSEWPWQTALYRVSNGHELFTCGGSLVAPGWVLSAAHCFGEGSTDDPAAWTVATRIGKLTPVGLPLDAETRKVKRLVVHEGYDKKTQENDIALMELAEPLQEPAIALELEPVTVTDRFDSSAGSGSNSSAIAGSCSGSASSMSAISFSCVFLS